MLNLLTAALFVSTAFAAQEADYKEYGKYNLLDALKTVQGVNGEPEFRLDTKLIDAVVDDLAAHARDYPPKFRSDEENSRAVRDAESLVAAFEILTENKDAHSELLLKAAFVDGIAYNLDIQGSGEKAVKNYERVLTQDPDNRRANLRYGIFLAGTGRQQKESLKYLEHALKLGVDDARYTLGLVHLTLGNNDKAVEYLEAYAKTRPKDERPKRLINAIQSGRVRVGKGP